MLLGFGRENQLENCFLLASISCIFCALDFNIETLLNWNKERRRFGSSPILLIAIARSRAASLPDNSPLTA